MTEKMAYPGTRYRLLPSDAHERLPAGDGGLAVRTWCPPWDEREILAPIVGVDGEPATYGWGEAVVVLPAGEHVVEVQYVEPVRSTMVSVAAGAVTRFEYSPAVSGDGGRARRSVGFRSLLIPLAFALVAAQCLLTGGGYLLLRRVGMAPAAAVPLLFGLAIAVVVGVPLFVHWRRGRVLSR